MTHIVPTQFLTPGPIEPSVVWVVLVIGLFLWLFGTWVARGSVALIGGTIGAAVAWVLAPRMGGIAPAIAIALGFAVGATMGVMAFKYVQSVVLATGLAAGTVALYAWMYLSHLPAAAANLMVMLPVPLAAPINSFLGMAARIPPEDIHRMLAAASGMATIGGLIGMGFPRLTTTAVTSLIGAGLLVLAGGSLMGQDAATWAVRDPATAGVAMAALALVGVAIQYRNLTRKADKGSKTPDRQHRMGRPMAVAHATPRAA